MQVYWSPSVSTHAARHPLLSARERERENEKDKDDSERMRIRHQWGLDNDNTTVMKNIHIKAILESYWDMSWKVSNMHR